MDPAARATEDGSAQADRAASLPRGTGTFMGGANPPSTGAYMAGWNEANYSDWPATRPQLGDPLAQTIPPGLQPHHPMGLGHNAPESLLGATPMAPAMHPYGDQRLSFDGQNSYMPASNQSSTNNGSGQQQQNYSSSLGGQGTDNDAWRYASSDEKSSQYDYHSFG